MFNIFLILKKDFLYEFRFELLFMIWMCKVFMFLGKKLFVVFVFGNIDCVLDLLKVDFMVFRVEKLSE